jgi:hypothetical protein
MAKKTVSNLTPAPAPRTARCDHERTCAWCKEQSNFLHETAEWIEDAADGAAALLEMRNDEDRPNFDPLMLSSKHLCDAISNKAGLIKGETMERRSTPISEAPKLES